MFWYWETILTEFDIEFKVFDDINEHVIVMDPRTGKVIGAPMAPTLQNMREFLLKNASYCTVLPARKATTGKQRTSVES